MAQHHFRREIFGAVLKFTGFNCAYTPSFSTSFDHTLIRSSRSPTVSIYGRECCIQGYHVYKDMWEAVIVEELECKREPSMSISTRWQY